MEIITGKITDYNERTGELIIRAPYSNYDRMILRQYDTIEIGLPDGRTIIPEQRMKAHALMNEITLFVTGRKTPDAKEPIERYLKLDFIVHRLEGLEKDLFSLASCDVTTAREFITYLIDFVIEHNVPTKFPPREMCEDIERYVYSCLKYKRCAVCGKPADLHHFDQIGMGNDRTEIYQIGMKVIPLCREHHGIAHSKGKSIITDDWHLVPIPLTKEIGKVYGLNKKNLEGEK